MNTIKNNKKIKDFQNFYGVNLFNDNILKKNLSEKNFNKYLKIKNLEENLTLNISNLIAKELKKWAIKKGAIYFTYWFHSLNGKETKKIESFFNISSDGKILLEFEGKDLLKGKLESSSISSGEFIDEFKSTGDIIWDFTTPPFLKFNGKNLILCIPSIVIFNKEDSLDEKLPLLKSMKVLNRETLRVLDSLGYKDIKKVCSIVATEQEYFLLNKKKCNRRSDLILTGRTLFGKIFLKGQKKYNHYFSEMKEKVSGFMKELDFELLKIGVLVKSKHSKVAPNQFKISTFFKSSNIAADNNSIVMEFIKDISKRHNMLAILQEKPFEGINGSYKYNNWSMFTDTNINLLEPGNTQEENERFLLFLVAIIKAIDKYAPLLRFATADLGNDNRIVEKEDPNSIISVFLGDILTKSFEKISYGTKLNLKEKMELDLGIKAIVKIKKDLSDKNRTSSFAFNGNKFKFRMAASSSLFFSNTVLNTIVADVLREFAEILEEADNKHEALLGLIIGSFVSHKRIIFNGNAYSKEWKEEAFKRDLPICKTSADLLLEIISEKSIKLFERNNVFNEEELNLRYNLYLERYINKINLEAKVMIDMSNVEILPVAINYVKSLAETVNVIRRVMPKLSTDSHKKKLKKILKNVNDLKFKTEELDKHIRLGNNIKEKYEKSKYYSKNIIKIMIETRKYGDNLEKIIDKSRWPFPSYEDLLF